MSFWRGRESDSGIDLVEQACKNYSLHIPVNAKELDPEQWRRFVDRSIPSPETVIKPIIQFTQRLIDKWISQ